MNLLIVDDCPASRQLLRVTLEAEGFQIWEAKDGVEALIILERKKIDAVIADILMPNMDGYRLCHELRQSDKLYALPVLLYSGTYTSDEDHALGLRVGADVCLAKPASREALLAALSETIRNAKARTRTRPEENGVHVAEELLTMKEYSEALVRKLEKRSSALQEAEIELRRLNHELSQDVHSRTEELEAANADLAAFDQSVAHDLRNPLTAVVSGTQLLQSRCQEKFDADDKRLVDGILNAARIMNDTLGSLLRLSECKHAELARRGFDLSDCVQWILRRLQQESPARKAAFTIDPDLRVDADSGLLQLALENLVGNAWKYTANTGHTHIHFGRYRREKEWVYFVRDNGAGFDMAQSDKLFRPFQRLHSSVEFPGSGVGLTIAERVITRHGGRIWADSKPGQGATFSFTLP